jgi:hypothetical protein
MADTHTTGWRPACDLRFAAALEAVSLAVGEIPSVAQSVPTAFWRSGARWHVIAVLSPGDGRNHFVTPDRFLWRGYQVPALLRAYPFRLQGAEDKLRLWLWPGVHAEPLGDGIEPFIVDGRHAPLVRQAISFLVAVQAEIDKAHAVLSCLDQAGALVAWTLPGHARPLALGGQEVRVLDTAAFEALDDALFVSLRRMGALGWLQAHLHSQPLTREFARTGELASAGSVALADLSPFQATPASGANDVLAAIAADPGDFEL